MRLKINGHEYIYTHECDESERGRKLTRSEIHRFLVDCLIEAYELKNIRCIRHDEDFNSGADFSFIKLGKTYCCKVKYIRNSDDAVADIQRMAEPNYNPQLKRGFEEHGIIPRIYYVEVQCISDDDDSFVAGGEYLMEFHPVQWLNSEKPTSAKDISDAELIKGYARAWETGDSKFLEDYISPYFDATSDLSFEQVTSKTEYIDHFKAQQRRWRDKGAIISTEMARDDKTGETGLFIRVNDKVLGFVIVNCKNFRISNTHTKKIPVSHSKWYPYVELYQTHGDHHAPFLDDDELLPYLKTSLNKKSSLCHKVITNVNLDKDIDFDTTVCSLKIGDPNIDKAFYLALLAVDREGRTNQFVSAYPYLQGKPTLVKILDILEWDNRIEATIKCVYEFDGEEFEFHFFATDYFASKHIYQIGNTIEIALAASSGNARVASKGFKFEGQKAIDFLSKMGKKPTYDENGEVDPVNFSTEKLVAFLVHDKKCPDEAEFQSPTEYSPYGDHIYFDARKPIRTRMITINNDTELKIPLYFSADFEIHAGDPLCGTLWLTGRLAYPGLHSTRDHINKFRDAAKFSLIAKNLLSIFLSRQLYNKEEHIDIMKILDGIEFPYGYYLYTAKVGNEESYYHRFYVSHTPQYFVPQRGPDGRLSVPIEENDHPQGVVPTTKLDSFPRLLERIGVRYNSAIAMWQAFLLYIGEHLMPRKGRLAEYRKYIFSPDDYKGNVIIENSDFTYFNLKPVVYFLSTYCGIVAIHYWDEDRGLIREVYTFTYNEGYVTFQLDATYTLIKYSSDSHILFRDGN